MGTYAGAVAAIKARLAANWATTPIAYQNEPAPEVTDGSGTPAPWVYCEITATQTVLRGVGVRGDQVFITDGLIELHVMAPQNTGVTTAMGYADQLGEIFRNQEFYNGDAGFAVRTWTPNVSDGGTGSDDGLWWRVTTMIGFEYFHRG